MNKTVD
jgi:hypothetical protein